MNPAHPPTSTESEFRIQNSEFRIHHAPPSAFRIPHSAFTRPRSAFTLIELLVVIAIIAVLMAILLPTMGYVKTQAKKAATASLMASIGTGLEQYYSDFNTFPPSENLSTAPLVDSTFNRGSLMLSEAMTGYLDYKYDGAGPTGNTNNPTESIFGFRTRAGGVGKIYGPYMPPTGSNWKIIDANHQVFVDSWGNEILYYRAVPTIISGQRRTTVNQIFGSLGNTNAMPGMTFTAYFNIDDNAKATNQSGSAIADPSSAVQSAPAAPQTKFFRLIGANSNTLAGGESLTGKDSYLLVSAGPDGIYFTSDDVVAGGK